MTKLVCVFSLGVLFTATSCNHDITFSSGYAGGSGLGDGATGGATETSGGSGGSGAVNATGATGGSSSAGKGPTSTGNDAGGMSGAAGSLPSDDSGSSTGAGATGAAGDAGAAGSADGPDTPVTLAPLVTSAEGAYWQTGGTLTDSTGAPDVTVNDAALAQKWDGFGGAFNELGWSYLTTKELQDQAMTLLFSAKDGAAFAWGRIPIGASNYAVSRYTEDDTGGDVTPNSDESNRPPADTALASYSLERDGQRIVPYVQAARAVNPKLRFWAGPWTPPVWMKTGYKKDGDNGAVNATKPSYFDGGRMRSDAVMLTAYAQYFAKFLVGYKAQGIDIELVSPQNEPTFDMNYPSCLWDAATYTAWVGQYLGPMMKSMGVGVMLGTLSNANDSLESDLALANAVLADPVAKNFVTLVGAEWGVLDSVVNGTTFGALPVWATEHKAGNYPWCTDVSSYCPSVYNSAQAPNDQAYGVESWGYIRDAIKKGKVTVYNAWNMVLDKYGLGIDTARDWKQDALLVVDSGKLSATPAYYVFRHFSQYVAPGAIVLGTTGGDAVAFKNPDGSLVAVMYNKAAANPNYVVAIGGKKLEFAMPGNGWATVRVTP